MEPTFSSGVVFGFSNKKISQPPPGSLLDSISNIFGYVDAGFPPHYDRLELEMCKKGETAF